MAIKQLQLRGISRTPSDRAVADGGCAESLNVHLDNAETASVLPPEDASDEIYGSGESSRYPIIFIHKMSGKTVYIGKTTETGAYGFYAYGSNITNHLMGNTKPVPAGETVAHVASIGNTLIVFTDANPYYYLFKGNSYVFLGSTIPGPMVEVVSKPAATPTWSNPYVEVAEGALRTASITTQSNITYADVSRWNDAKIEGDECYAELQETMANAWGAIMQGVAEQRSLGIFAAPFFVRYAVRLYDGSYIYSSTPILCGAGKSVDWATMELLDAYVTPTDEGYEGRYLRVHLNNLFEVHVKGSNSYTNWSDIVKSIDFFASEPIYTPAQEAKFYHMADRTMPESTYLYSITLEGMDASIRDVTIRNAVLSKGQFYKIKSVELSGNISEFTGGTMKLEASASVSGDNLYTQDTFPDSYRDSIQYLPVAETMNFNGRLLLIGAKEVLGRGDMFLNGQMAMSNATAIKYEFRYKIVNPINGDVNYVMAHYRNGETQLQPAFFDSSGTQYYGNESATSAARCSAYSWLCYPDTRCQEVEVSYWTANNVRYTYRVPMTQHPFLECVYAFFGFGITVQQGVNNSGPHQGTQISYSSSESRTMVNPNKLVLSEFENPFLFPAENIITFKDSLIGAATVSVPLSEGQYGEYPLYAFTEGGIRVLVVNAEGTIAAANAHPNLSRHVALPGMILGMEQAVIFATERGVMRLSGNQVTELSAAMIGPAYVLDDSVMQIISTADGWGDILNASENITLNEYMSQAKVAYDSKNYRLVFFRDGKAYQFVYKLDTQTWHKIYTGITGARILNSYPECLVAYTDTAAKVARFSNLPTAAMYANMTANHVYGIIATRPFDLDAPDIRKSINDIRIRGRYNRADVQYILLGSFDGINWKRLTSLRGGSYKVFRLVLLTKLTASERVTWIDVDYETRMTNRLR